MLDKIKITDLNIINLKDGDLYHGIRENDECFDKFGEIYFSTVNKNLIKGWKMHKKMTMNLIVPNGEIRFNFIDSLDIDKRYEINLSLKNYKRITVQPGVIFGFKGLSDRNILVNISNMIHDDNEVMNYNIEEYIFI